MKPTKTAEELKGLIIEAADPKREYLRLTIVSQGEGRWGMIMSGSSIPRAVSEAANREHLRLIEEYALAE